MKERQSRAPSSPKEGYKRTNEPRVRLQGSVGKSAGTCRGVQWGGLPRVRMKSRRLVKHFFLKGHRLERRVTVWEIGVSGRSEGEREKKTTEQKTSKKRIRRVLTLVEEPLASHACKDVFAKEQKN